jgi:hypothetical protein
MLFGFHGFFKDSEFTEFSQVSQRYGAKEMESNRLTNNLYPMLKKLISK